MNNYTNYMKNLKQFEKELRLKLNNIYTALFQDSLYDEKQLKEKEDIMFNFFTNYLKDLKESCVGEEKGLKVHKDLHTNKLEEGYNEKRQEVLDIFNKLGI